jgi:hypothetical protein
MPHKCRPTGPIYQPEVAAAAIVFAAEHPWRKKLVVGFPAWEAVVGEKFIPGALDHYLAHAAWEGSQLSEPADPDEIDNFWQPLPGDHGSHGPFDSMAKKHSAQLWAAEHRTGLLAALAGLGVALAAAALTPRKTGRQVASKAAESVNVK